MVRRATALVIVIMCLVAVSEAGYGASNGGLGEVPLVAALAVLPLLYVLPVTRPLWLRHRYLLLAVQAALTYVPFALFGTNWAPSGWLAGLVLLTVPSPASWFVAAILAALEEAMWAGVLGLPYQPAALWAMFAFVFDALILFGLARLADLVTAVHAARDELAETAVTAERVRAADSLRAAIGDRLAEAAGRAAAALQAIAGSPPLAREHIAATAVTARQALGEVREVAARYRDAPWPEAATAEPGEPAAPRLAQSVLVVTLCGLAVLYPLFVAENNLGVPGGYSTPVVAWAVADAVAVVILQLRHSWPPRGVARPRGWPVTLLLQAVLTYALFPATGWHPLIMCGFLAGSALTARADMRLVAGEARDLPLDAELAAARGVLASAGIDVRARVSADPPPEAAAVLVPVVREAVTNILKHSSASYCVLEMTADASLLRLLIRNDGSDDADRAPLAAAGRTGNGLRNLAARLEAAGGHLATRREDGTFSLTAEIPLA